MFVSYNMHTASYLGTEYIVSSSQLWEPNQLDTRNSVERVDQKL
jgi:hypothetical protein